MTKIKYFAWLWKVLILSCLPLTVWSANCSTHESCPVGTVCECQIPASSAYGRYFYFDVPNIQNHTAYHCHASNVSYPYMLVISASTFPKGSVPLCQGSCPYFPVDLLLDTTAMEKDQDVMILKYYVSPSDVPGKINFSCTES